MTPEEFVLCIRREVLEKYLKTLCEEMEEGVSGTYIRESHWPDLADFYRSLNADQRLKFMAATRQTMVDTLSYVFGVLDGSTLLEKHRDYFHLTYGDTPQELNGELQDLFLSPET